MGPTTFDAVDNGWAIPTATDIAFSYLVDRTSFGAVIRPRVFCCRWLLPMTRRD
ncbi:MAG: hypothetical protein AAF922_16150 [Pseudomonadota bacterium]